MSNRRKSEKARWVQLMLTGHRRGAKKPEYTGNPAFLVPLVALSGYHPVDEETGEPVVGWLRTNPSPWGPR